MIEGYPEIAKDVAALKAPPNLVDWAAARQSFSWDEQWKGIDRPGGMLNKAYECVDRHANGARANKTAIIWQSAAGEIERYSYLDFKKQTNKAANALRALGIK